MCQPSRVLRIAAIAFLTALFFSVTYAGEAPLKSFYQEVAEKICSQGLQQRYAFKLLEQLTTQVGHRLTGSPNAAAALELTSQWMHELGLEEVHLEPIVVQRWVRGQLEELKIINSSIEGTVPLTVCALGGSVGTDDSGVTTHVIEVASFLSLIHISEPTRPY